MFFGRSEAHFGSFFSRDFHQSNKLFPTPLTLVPLFINRAQIDAVEELEMYEQTEEIVIPDFLECFSRFETQDFLSCDHLRSRTHRFVLRLAKRCERNGEYREALSLYSRLKVFKSGVGRITALKRLGRTSEIPETIQQLLDETNSSSFNVYAEEQLGKIKERSRRSVRALVLKQAEIIQLAACSDISLEEDVCFYFRKQEVPAFHTENWLFQELYRLFCEELLKSGLTRIGLANSLATRPAVLYSEELYKTYPLAVDEVLSWITDQKLGEWLETWKASRDAQQILFSAMTLFLKSASAESVKLILKDIVHNPSDRLSGYPDLLVQFTHGICFIEVKGQGDSVRIEQVAAIRRLQASGFEVHVKKAVYAPSVQIRAKRVRLKKRQLQQLTLF